LVSVVVCGDAVVHGTAKIPMTTKAFTAIPMPSAIRAFDDLRIGIAKYYKVDLNAFRTIANYNEYKKSGWSLRKKFAQASLCALCPASFVQTALL
jgi:hypothetical protein